MFMGCLNEDEDQNLPEWRKLKMCACGCGEEFTPRRPWAKFAGDSCRDAYWARRKREALDVLMLSGEGAPTG